VPLNERPMAVLVAPTMTGVAMFLNLGLSSCRWQHDR
jgi:hypothetical protein